MSRKDVKLSGCGELCILCSNYLGNKEPKCVGCNPTKGNPFWGECKTYACIEEQEVDHCGKCEEFPCNDLVGHYNPNNPNGQRNAITRIGLLAFRSKNGDKATIELIKKIGEPPRG